MKSRFLMVAASCLLWVGVALAQVNINTATREQLDGLKGIGPTKAQAIVDYRRKNGPFKSVDELENVPGIGPGTLKDLRRDVVVSGSTRAPVEAPAAAPRKESAAPAVARPAAPTPAKPMADAAKPAAPSPARPQESTAAPMAKPAAPSMPAKPAMESKGAPAAPAAPTVAKPAPLPERRRHQCSNRK